MLDVDRIKPIEPEMAQVRREPLDIEGTALHCLGTAGESDMVGEPVVEVVAHRLAGCPMSLPCSASRFASESFCCTSRLVLP